MSCGKKPWRLKVWTCSIPGTFPTELDSSGPVFRKVVAALAGQAELFYPVKSETFFKQKYNPTWEELYFCANEDMSLGLLHDLLKAFQPKGILGMLGRSLRS